MNIYLDDIRSPLGDCVIVRNGEDCIELLKLIPWEKINSLSFDHDLGEGKITGHDVALFIESMCYLTPGLKPPIWYIHSANPVGRENIRNTMNSATRFYNNYLKSEGK